MSISPNDAAAALNEIEQTSWRSSRSAGYRFASSYMILWGALWLVGYGMMAVLPGDDWWKVWLPADLIGVGGSMWIGLQRRGKDPSAKAHAVRGLALSVLGGLFIGVVYLLFQPRTQEVYWVFPAVALGGIYSCIGLFRMPRFLVIGVWILAAAVIGHLFLKPWLSLWIAAAVGGSMILGGLWLRRG